MAALSSSNVPVFVETSQPYAPTTYVSAPLQTPQLAYDAPQLQYAPQLAYAPAYNPLVYAPGPLYQQNPPVYAPQYTPTYSAPVLMDELSDEVTPVNTRRFNSNVQSGIQQIGQGNMNLQGNIQQVGRRSAQIQKVNDVIINYFILIEIGIF